MALSVASWNVNSVRQRLDLLRTYLQEIKPDVLCLQELKCINEAFPESEMSEIGYQCAVHGQKGFNGVAILSRLPLQIEYQGLPGDENDLQSRYLEAIVEQDTTSWRIATLYLPNGNPLESEKFSYKLAWMNRLNAHAQRSLALEEKTIFAGDFNVIPSNIDCKNPQDWTGDALYQPQSRQAFRTLQHLGYVDALRACSDDGGLYTFWDYQKGAFQRNNGIRIDHLLLSPQSSDCLQEVVIDRFMRAKEKPSDHVPIRAIFQSS